MHKGKLIKNILLETILFVFGLHKPLQCMSLSPLPEAVDEIMKALVKSICILVIFEIISGIDLQITKYVPLALIVVFPALLHAYLSHLLEDISRMDGALLAIAMNVFLFFGHNESCKPIRSSP